MGTHHKTNAEDDKTAFAVAYSAVCLSGVLFGLLIGWILWA